MKNEQHFPKLHKKTWKIGIVFILMILSASLLVQSKPKSIVTNTPQSVAQSETMHWQSAPDWILNLTKLNDIVVGKSWFEQLFLALAQSEFEAVIFKKQPKYSQLDISIFLQRMN